jgi:hypothetical protein
MAAWSKAIIPVAIIALVVFAGSRLMTASDPVIQPIEYSHKLHVQDEGLECIDCHLQVEEKPYATIPSIEVCTDCHDEEPISESPEELKLVEHIKRDSTIAWKRIYRVPDHVYFSHRRHVVLGEISCASCHGNVAEQEAPVRSPQFDMHMDWCMDCHRENKVSNDCLSCHR